MNNSGKRGAPIGHPLITSRQSSYSNSAPRKEIISIDLSRRSSDKYTFLEIFLSAREKIFLFYTGRNNIDNEKLQPSPLLTELSEYLDRNFQCEDGSGFYKSIHEEEKLQPFDRDYFSRDSSLFSYSARDFNLARIYYNDKEVNERNINYEKIPLKQDVDEYFKKEVIPHVPDAWMDRSKDKIGYEINFTKYFYEYKPLRPLQEIKADILALENETEGLLKEILK